MNQRSFADIVKILEKHYNPKPLEIAQSFHFGTPKQESGESISDYILALRRLAVHCNYGEFLDRALRDRFVCGLSNAKIQNKLLNSEELTFEKACRVAKSMEMAERNTQFKKFTLPVAKVNKLSVHVCHRCGGNHSGQSCKFRSAKCYKCSKVDHLASVCRSKDSIGKGKIHSMQGSQLGADVPKSDSDEF